jgi:hypothetical protein
MYRIEFIRPVIIEGRDYQPFSFQYPDQWFPRTATGREKMFRRLDAAVTWASERFGDGYKSVLRIYRK